MASVYEQIIIDVFELSRMTPPKNIEVTEQLMILIFLSVSSRAPQELSEEEIDEYFTLLAQGEGPDFLLSFFEQKIPNFIGLLKAEAEKLKELMINVFEVENDDKIFGSQLDSTSQRIELSGASLIGMKIIGWIVQVVWAVLGFILWIPLLVRVVAAFCGTLVYHMVVQNPNAVNKSSISLKLAIEFWGRGFKAVEETTKGIQSGNQFKVNPFKKEDFNVNSFIAQIAWTILFWGILILPFII